MFLKEMAIHPQLVETQKLSAWCSQLEPLVPGPRRSVPNGSTQHFMWSTHWLHLSQRLLSTFCKETTSLLLPSDSVFFLVVEVFHHKRPNLAPYKDWKRVSKQRQVAKTREDIPRQQPHPKITTAGTESFKVTLKTLATSTELNSGASIFSERLSSCSAPGATAVGTLDLGHPMHALPKWLAKSWKNIRIREHNMKLLCWKESLKHVERDWNGESESSHLTA